MIKDIAIIGAGGFGKEVKFLIDRVNDDKKVYNFLGYFDDNESLDNINGSKRIGSINDLENYNKPLCIVFGIGEPNIKRNIYNIIKDNKFLSFPNIIDPLAIIGNEFVNLGIGNVICAGVIITCNINIIDFVTLNLSCTVGHDTTIKSFSSFMPSVNISGDVVIEENVYVGTGAKIINLLNIGSSTVIGAGAVVARSIPSNCTAVGIPAKPIKFHNEQ